MRYFIAQRWTLGKEPVEISKADFQAIREAKEGAVRAMLIEEKLELVLDNFVEYEGEYLQLALRSAVFEEYEWSDFRAATQRVNRRLANLLTTCRLYLDQMPNALKDRELKAAFKAQKEKEKADRLGYATMEELRNHVQHRDLPVTGVAYPSAWVPEDTREWRKHIVEAFIDLDEFGADRQTSKEFKEDVLPKLRAQGDALNWKVLVREYISGIGAIHNDLRARLAPKVKEWDERILVTLRDYQAATQANLAVGVEAVTVNDQGEDVEVIAVFTGPMDRRRALEQKTRNPGFWTRILVTSE
jgi:hypothetical protein